MRAFGLGVLIGAGLLAGYALGLALMDSVSEPAPKPAFPFTGCEEWCGEKGLPI